MASTDLSVIVSRANVNAPVRETRRVCGAFFKIEQVYTIDPLAKVCTHPRMKAIGVKFTPSKYNR